jgi:hypothetical protein
MTILPLTNMQRELKYWILVLVVFPYGLMAQGFDCVKVISEYYAENPTGDVGDSAAFCAGAKWASEGSLKVLGSFWETRPCECYAYEKYGVKTVTMSCIVMNSDSEAWASRGFNYVMDKRFKNELGDRAALLGKVQPEWFGIDERWSLVIRKHFEVKMISKDSARVRVIDTTLDYLDGMLFEIRGQNKSDKTSYTITQLKEGIVFKPKGKRLFLIFITKNYNNPNYCKCGNVEWYSVAFPIDQ